MKIKQRLIAFSSYMAEQDRRWPTRKKFEEAKQAGDAAGMKAYGPDGDRKYIQSKPEDIGVSLTDGNLVTSLKDVGKPYSEMDHCKAPMQKDWADAHPPVENYDDYAAIIKERIDTNGFPGYPPFEFYHGWVKHLPVLDLDFPAYCLPSRTPGHTHLYIDKDISWWHMKKLMDAFALAGLIEVGYKNASKARGYSAVRTGPLIEAEGQHDQFVKAQLEEFENEEWF